MFAMPKLLTIKPLAEQKGIPVRTIRTLMHQRKVPFIRAGHRTVFFDPDKFQAALDRLEVKAVA